VTAFEHTEQASTLVLINRSAGSFRKDGGRLSEEIEGHLCTLQKPYSLLTLDGKDVAPEARKAVDAGVRFIVVAGGDGTANAVAGALVGSAATLGILPLGTLNHLAKDLGIPLTLKEAIETAFLGEDRLIDVGMVNGRAFLNNSSLGVYPHLVRHRDRERHHPGWRRTTSALKAAWRVFVRPPVYEVTIESGGVEVRRRTPFVFVGNNPYCLSLFNFGGRECIDKGVLSLYASDRPGRMALLKVFLSTLFLGKDRVPDFDHFESTMISIRARRRSIPVSIDGEVFSLKSPLHYVIQPRSLRVRVPRKVAQAAPPGDAA
jgi:diacylglycerol kinase family enzyme